jgi:hypothetical protein
MNKNAEAFLIKTLGGDFLKSLGENLSKSEIYKQGTRTVIDTNDLFQGLQIVPRALLSLLIRELAPMQIDDNKDVEIPGKEHTVMKVTKHERDSFSGQVIQNNIKIYDFMHRSIPGIGLVLMSLLELYNVEEIDEHQAEPSREGEINRIIDERMNLHALVNKVVDGKLMQRDAIQQLFVAKLNQLSQEHKKIVEDHKEIMAAKEEPKPAAIIIIKPKKPRPLEEFVENRKKKLNKKEHFIKMEKSEAVSCGDCGQSIFSDGIYSGCICYGENNKKLHIKKSEDGYKIRFGRGWDVENIEMLLEVLRGNKNG